MNSKRTRREHPVYSNKKRRNIITFEMKLDIVNRYENKERSCDIARTLNLSQSTVRTILLQSDKIKERSKRLATLMGTKFLRPRSHTMENMEKRLAEWIKYEKEKNNPISLLNIQEKARELYESIRVELNDVEAKPFVASHGWLDRFKKRMKLFNLSPAVEEPPISSRLVDTDLIDSFIFTFQGIIEDGGYSPKQIFNLDEFALCWKWLPTCGNTSPNRDMTQRDRLTLLLGANANGDCKLKPVLVYHSSNPPALRGYSKDHLPVVWRYNSKGVMSSSIFTDYFCNRLTSELKDYCLREKIPFKILLVLDSATYHPRCLEDFSENIKVVFLPPTTNTMLQRLDPDVIEFYYTMIQPMDQGVIEYFKANYLQLVFNKIVDKIYRDGKDALEETLRRFDIKNAVDIIGQAWEKIDQNYLKSVWFRIWPDHAGGHKPFEVVDNVTQIKLQIIALGESVGLKTDLYHTSKFLFPHKDELTPEELRQLTDEVDEDDHGIRTLSPEEMVEAFQHIEAAMTIFDEHDYNRERSFKVIRNLESAIECYKQMYKERKKNLTGFSNLVTFVKVETPEERVEKVETDEPQVQISKSDNSNSDDLCEDEDPISEY